VTDLRGALNGEYASRPLEAIAYLVVHHTGANVDNTPEQIDAYHRTLVDSYGNLWPGIGYHMVVKQTGEVYYVGDARTKRANVYGRNGEVFGIVLCGDFSTRQPNPAQIAGAKAAIRFALEEIGRGVPIVGHREAALTISPTSCPGDTWPEWKDKLF